MRVLEKRRYGFLDLLYANPYLTARQTEFEFDIPRASAFSPMVLVSSQRMSCEITLEALELMAQYRAVASWRVIYPFSSLGLNSSQSPQKSLPLVCGKNGDEAS